MVQATTAQLSKEVIEKVLQFGRLLERDGVSVNKLIVFGSYAKNNFTSESDIDVCVVSDKFGKNPIDEFQFLSKESRKVDTRIEPHPVSLVEFNEFESPLIWEIRLYGMEVVS